jgi:O-antigen/teichoic acid export membrane protein
VLQTEQTSHQTGKLTIEATRYCTLLLGLFGLPLVFVAYSVLKLWIGRSYATQSICFLQGLILGNVIRQVGHPHSLAVIATGKQHLATIAGVAEALVNICVSQYLVQRIGAVGVAIGTVIGALVSMGLHLILSMRYIQSAIAISRRNLVIQGILRALLCTTPSLLLIPAWNRFAMLLWSIPWLASWSIATLLITWHVALTETE